MGNNNNKFRDNTWIAILVERKGEDYIDNGLTSYEVSRNSERILDDIIKGRIDYNNYGKHLIKPVILDTLISFCATTLAKLNAYSYALGYVKTEYDNNAIMHAGNIVTDKLQSYTIDGYKTPGIMTDSLANNVSQLVSIVNQDIMIYYQVYNTLQAVSVSRNPFDFYALNNSISKYVEAKNRIGRTV